jgi:hypothetical protein
MSQFESNAGHHVEFILHADILHHKLLATIELDNFSVFIHAVKIISLISFLPDIVVHLYAF